MGFEDEYAEITRKSWMDPVENVNRMIETSRKKIVPFHSKENHDYHMSKWKKCVYCENGIPLEDCSVEAKK